jgi:hypothetical protein
MASITQTPSGAFQPCVKNKLLPKPLWATFDTRDAAEQYGAQLERLLVHCRIPHALLRTHAGRRLPFGLKCRERTYPAISRGTAGVGSSAALTPVTSAFAWFLNSYVISR